MHKLANQKLSGEQPLDLKSPDVGRKGLAVFFRIAARWTLDVPTQMVLLGIRSRSTYYRWRKLKNRSLKPDTLVRLSYIFGIYKALQILLPKADLADGWMHKPNTAPLFKGKSALDYMRGGQVADLRAVRRYLDSVIANDIADIS
ncbi:MAG: DUF2384 domain-containing protein [Betaproteobacteria bacterium]|nr:DUF2384 domain-containing protein [Betaproteobacteria bacterium]